MSFYERTNNRSIQDLLNPNSPKITQVVNEGQISVIKPNVHIHDFYKSHLNLVEENESTIITVLPTIKHIFVDQAERDLLLSCYKFDCRSSGNLNLKSNFIRISATSK